jgi:hypothetical protein
VAFSAASLKPVVHGCVPACLVKPYRTQLSGGFTNYGSATRLARRQ